MANRPLQHYPRLVSDSEQDQTDRATDIARCIGRFASDDRYRHLVVEYFDPHGSFAGTTFSDLAPNDPRTFSAADILAASLLDVGYKPAAVRSLVLGSEGPSIAELLPADVDLWVASFDDLDRVDSAFSRLSALPGIGRVKASKLLARKRPSLVPVLDRVVDAVFGLEKDRFHPSVRAIREALTPPRVREQVESLRPPGVSVPTIRILDAAVWMAGSNSRTAQAARVRVGLPREPDRTRV